MPATIDVKRLKTTGYEKRYCNQVVFGNVIVVRSTYIIIYATFLSADLFL